MAEGPVERTMLFDFYGELLTEKQREYFDLHYNEDLSLAEIADIGGISRQGVWDIIRRGGGRAPRDRGQDGPRGAVPGQAEALSEIESKLSTLLGSADENARDTAREVIAALHSLDE